jgi:hypothetical protein
MIFKWDVNQIKFSAANLVQFSWRWSVILFFQIHKQNDFLLNDHRP